jgi:hypothetical protein
MMAVKLNTAEEGQFNPDPFVKSWWEKKQRRIGGDGERKRKAAPLDEVKEPNEEVLDGKMPYYG